MSDKKGEWLLVRGENFMTMQPMYNCSICNNIISDYFPPDKCNKCGAVNEYKLNSVPVRLEVKKV